MRVKNIIFSPFLVLTIEGDGLCLLLLVEVPLKLLIFRIEPRGRHEKELKIATQMIICTGIQGCGSGSGLDPDSMGCLDPDSDSESGSRGKKKKKIKKKSKPFY
jgi:hypothetical protein